MKSKKVFIILGGLTAVGAAIYFIFREDESRMGGFVRKVEGSITGKPVVFYPQFDVDENKQQIYDKPASGGCSGYVPDNFPLQKCDKGSKVKALQTILNELYLDKIGAKITVDGYFGPKTEAALFKATGKTKLSMDEYNSLASATVAKNNVEAKSDSESIADYIFPDWFSDMFD